MRTNTRVISSWILVFVASSALLLAGDSWRKKTPDQWEEDEIHQVLTNSPWARKAKIVFAGQTEQPRAGERTSEDRRGPSPDGSAPGVTTPTAGPGPAPRSGGPGHRLDFDPAWSQPVIRWQGSEAVRSAYAKARVQAPGAEHFRDYYVIAAVGLLNPEPAVPALGNRSSDKLQQKLQRNTQLEIGRQRGIAPDRVEVFRTDGDPLILFFFPRAAVRNSDRVRFTSQFETFTLEAEFNPKEMQFGGSLDL